MRAPSAVGVPIDSARATEWVKRFADYRKPVTESAIEEWLDQFDEQHRDLAARLLDSVEYFSHPQIDDAFRTVLARLPGWHLNKAKRVGEWRFVPLGAAGESGASMLHRFKIANRLDFPKLRELFIFKSQLLKEGLGPGDSVVFVDDFAGTGRQAVDAWNQMAELLPDGPHTYLVLVAASSDAMEVIGKETGLKTEPFLTLAREDDVFGEDCLYFSGRERDILLEYCRVADKKQPRGYGACGLVLVLAHRCPSNSIPVLHATGKKFRGLFPRN